MAKILTLVVVTLHFTRQLDSGSHQTRDFSTVAIALDYLLLQ